MNEDLEERLREITATVLGVDPDLLSDGTSPETLADWKSVQHLSLIAAVEEAFAIRFSMAEIHAAQRFGALRQIVSEHIARGPAHG